MTERVSVIIPFYQRVAGVLPRALASIIEQRLAGDTRINVIIVDDQSPVDPADEVAGITLPPHVSLEILRRPNGGPAAARNTGLDHVPETCDAIALLDSDDAWTPDHLQSGLDALAAGADFYFDDHMTLGDGGSYFRSLLQAEQAMDCGLPTSVPGERYRLAAPERAGGSLHAFRTGEAVAALCSCYLAHTSTMIYRRSSLGVLRFDTRLKVAGEDYYFSFLLAQAAALTVYSDAVGCIQGRGVNIYHSNVTRGSAANLHLLRDALLGVLRMQAALGDNPRAGAVLERTVEARRDDFAWAWVTTGNKLRRWDLESLRTVSDALPGFAGQVPFRVAAQALGRIRR